MGKITHYGMIATGMDVPEKRLTSAELEKIVVTTDEWITTRSGIKERRILGPEESVSDIGVNSARIAMKKAGIGPEDIDAIICATFTGDTPCPATACHIQHKLGAFNSFACDIAASCSGFVYGLTVADSFIKNGFCLTALVVGSDGMTRFTDYQDKIQERVNQLIMHLNPVLVKAETIKKIKSSDFWHNADFQSLEDMRLELRGIMHHKHKGAVDSVPPKTIDVTDGGIVLKRHTANIKSVDMQLYRQMVEETLEKLFDTSLVLQKIRRAEPVTQRDISSLISLVLTQNPDVNLETLKEFYPDAVLPLDFIIRTIVGMEPEAVEKRFAAFAQKFTDNSKQTHFLRLLKNHIRRYGTINMEKLYEPPFTGIDSNGLDGVFEDDRQINELVRIIETFQPQTGAQA